MHDRGWREWSFCVTQLSFSADKDDIPVLGVTSLGGLSCSSGGEISAKCLVGKSERVPQERENRNPQSTSPSIHQTAEVRILHTSEAYSLPFAVNDLHVQNQRKQLLVEEPVGIFLCRGVEMTLLCVRDNHEYDLEAYTFLFLVPISSSRDLVVGIRQQIPILGIQIAFRGLGEVRRLITVPAVVFFGSECCHFQQALKVPGKTSLPSGSHNMNIFSRSG